MKKLLLLTAVLLGAATASQAGVGFSFSIGLPLAPTVCAPRGIYQAPPPVYTYAPAYSYAPRYCAPAPVYTAPAPVYYPPVYAPAPTVYFGFGPRWYGYHRGYYPYHYRGGWGHRGWRR